tara:strand:+ start:16554 stop:16853 length:300 start_codon:yes stop_codon:yes gene_type:complete
MDKQNFKVVCGEFEKKIELDKSLFASYEAACTEAATRAIEEYFSSEKSLSHSLSIYCTVEEELVKSRFIILTYFVLRNASMFNLSLEFERKTDQYQEKL